MYCNMEVLPLSNKQILAYYYSGATVCDDKADLKSLSNSFNM